MPPVSALNCSDAAPSELLKAIAEFNRREYFQSHETLEAIWLQETGPLRSFFQAIIQLSAGLLHIERGNHTGALSLLEQGIGKLEPFPDRCLGIDTHSLRTQARRCRDSLLALGEDSLKEFAWDAAPRIEIVSKQ